MRIKYKTIKTLPRKTTQPTLDYIALNFKRGKQYQYVTTLHKLQSSKWSPNSRNEYLLSQGDFFCVYRNIPSYAYDLI